jgi:hypothetical protein
MLKYSEIVKVCTQTLGQEFKIGAVIETAFLVSLNKLIVCKYFPIKT